MISSAGSKYRLKMKMNKEIENLYKISQLAGDSYEIWWIISPCEIVKISSLSTHELQLCCYTSTFLL